MDANDITIACAERSSILYTVIWALFVPSFLSYLAAAAYAFQRRRVEFSSAMDGLETMNELTMLALNRVNGAPVDAAQVQKLGSRCVRRVRLESLHRPKAVQQEMHDLLVQFLVNADIADGTQTGTPRQIIGRMTDVESSIIRMLKAETVFEALKQAWTNPGIKVSFDDLVEKFSSFTDGRNQS